jgi:FMN phosphatase YigB (HAD superfamily)
MVGDSWENDVLGARAAGIRAVWLNRRGVLIPDPALAGEIGDLGSLTMSLGSLAVEEKV